MELLYLGVPNCKCKYGFLEREDHTSLSRPLPDSPDEGRTVRRSSASAGDARVARVHASAILVPRATCRASPPTNLVPRILIRAESARSPFVSLEFMPSFYDNFLSFV